MNNAWFSEKGVLGELKKQDSAIVRIVHTQRNFLAKSLILVEKVGGVQQMYFLDTDIGFAYRLTAVK